MQIHEITYNKKPVQEGAWDAVKGIGSIAAGGVNKALGTNIGGAMAGANMGAGTIAAQTASAQLAKTLVPKITQEQNKAWEENLKGLMKNQQAMSVSDLDRSSVVQAVNDQVNRLLNTYNVQNWKDLPSKVNPAAYGGSGTQAARKVVQDMGKAIDQLVKNTINPGINSVELSRSNMGAWQNIANMVIQIQNLSQFASGSGPAKSQSSGAAGSAARTATSTGGVASPSTQAAMAALGTNAQGLAQLNALVKRSGGQKLTPTGNQYVDALLKSAKLL